MSGTPDRLTLLGQGRFDEYCAAIPPLSLEPESADLPIEERRTFPKGGAFVSDSCALEGLTVHVQSIAVAVNKFMTAAVLSDSGLAPMAGSAYSSLASHRQAQHATALNSAVMSHGCSSGLFGSIRMPSAVAFVSQSSGASAMKMTLLFGRIPETAKPTIEDLVSCFNLVSAWLRTKHELLSGVKQSRGIAINLGDFIKREWPPKIAAALIMGAWHDFRMRYPKSSLKHCQLYVADEGSMLDVKDALLEYADLSEGFSYYAVLDLLITRRKEGDLNDNGCALDATNRRLSDVSLVMGDASPRRRAPPVFPVPTF